MPDVRQATELLAQLNPQQRAAVEAADGPVLVLAGPGSGKTRVLTYRVAYLVRAAGVTPWRIMAVTFTNKAAREMASRLADLIGPEALAELTIGTFHAFCARLLRREAEALPFGRDFVIFDQADQLRAVRLAMAQLNLDEKTYRPQSVLGAISRAKNELHRPGEFPTPTYWHEIAGRIYRSYQEILRASNALDFDDLLLEAVDLLRGWPEVCARYRRRYRHILVDEFQDTNTAQYVLLKLLAGVEGNPDQDEGQPGRRNLFVVGDEDQSIYRWRGADYRNLLRFRSDFKEAQTLLLEQNYRSTQTILDAARAVIERNAQRTRKKLWTEAGPGTPITVFEAYDQAEEAVYVVHEIEKRVAAGQLYGDMAVMYRTNAQSRTLEDALVRQRIPYQLVGATRFYERREIKDVLAYLRLVHNPLDELALERVINVPPRGIGRVAWRGLTAWSEALALPRWSALQLMATSDGQPPDAPPLAGRTQAALCRFHDLVADLIAARRELAASELVAYVLETTGYQEWLRDGSEEGEERWENVRELMGVAAEYDALSPEEGLAGLLEAAALVSDVDALEEAPDRVTLLTLHSAKGLEFPVVFITGVEEGILPHSRSFDDQDSLAEERRLFYVGLTRAKEKVYLVHCFRRTLFGIEDVRDPSRFLRDIPAELIEDLSAAEDYSPRPPVDTWPATAETAAGDALFRPGDRVLHPRFGEGVVVRSQARDGDQEVTVAFLTAGVKKLMQSLARLERA